MVQAQPGGDASGDARGGRDIPADWPSLHGICVEPNRVRAKVPGGARAIRAECITHAVKHVAFFNDEKAWRQLFELPKMVLGAPSGRGGTNKKKGGPTREVTDRCRRWLEGERGALWPKPPKNGKGGDPIHPVSGGPRAQGGGLCWGGNAW